MEPKEKLIQVNGETVTISLTLNLSKTSIKYLLSSVVAFIIDYFILLLLCKYLPYLNISILNPVIMEVSALIAWMISSIINFFINRSFVFKSDSKIPLALAEYYGLAGIVFLLKTYVLIEILTRVLLWHIVIAKPIAEVIFFIINYFVQKLVIFKK